jgi:hypothetical protein
LFVFVCFCLFLFAILFSGSGCVENVLDSLVQQLLLFVQGTANCQQIDDHSDDDEEEEGAEDHDFILMDSVTDLIGTLARAFGGRFVNHAAPLLQPLGRFLAPNRLHTDRSMAIGCYAELVQGIGGNMDGQHCASMLQVGQMGLSDAHHEVQRNACFLLGVVYVNMAHNPQSVPALAAALPNVLQGLKPLVEGRGQLDHMLVDNACSAVSKGNTLVFFWRGWWFGGGGLGVVVGVVGVVFGRRTGSVLFHFIDLVVVFFSIVCVFICFHLFSFVFIKSRH